MINMIIYFSNTGSAHVSIKVIFMFVLLIVLLLAVSRHLPNLRVAKWVGWVGVGMFNSCLLPLKETCVSIVIALSSRI